MSTCEHRWLIGDVPVSPPGLTATPVPAVCRLCGAERTFLASLEGGPRNKGWYGRKKVYAREEAL